MTAQLAGLGILLAVAALYGLWEDIKNAVRNVRRPR